MTVKINFFSFALVGIGFSSVDHHSSFRANTVYTLVASGDFEAKTTRQRPKLRATRLSPQSLPLEGNHHSLRSSTYVPIPAISSFASTAILETPSTSPYSHGCQLLHDAPGVSYFQVPAELQPLQRLD